MSAACALYILCWQFAKARTQNRFQNEENNWSFCAYPDMGYAYNVQLQQSTIGLGMPCVKVTILKCKFLGNQLFQEEECHTLCNVKNFDDFRRFFNLYVPGNPLEGQVIDWQTYTRSFVPEEQPVIAQPVQEDGQEDYVRPIVEKLDSECPGVMKPKGDAVLCHNPELFEYHQYAKKRTLRYFNDTFKHTYFTAYPDNGMKMFIKIMKCYHEKAVRVSREAYVPTHFMERIKDEVWIRDLDHFKSWFEANVPLVPVEGETVDMSTYTRSYNFPPPF